METVNMESLLQQYGNAIKSSPMTSQDNVEFEVRFGDSRGRDSNIRDPITKPKFERIFKSLVSHGFDSSLQEHLLRVSFQNSSIRCELNNLKDIQDYCRSNSVVSVNHDFVLKDEIGNIETPIYFPHMNFRIGIKNEKLLNATNNEVKQIYDNWSSSIDGYRYINRTSLTHDDFPNIRVDMSMIQRHRKNIRVFKDIISKPNKDYIYEVEAELINIDKTNFDSSNILAQIKKVIKFVMSGIQDTNFPVSYTEQDKVIHEYLELTKNHGVDIKSPKIKKSKFFIGPSSKTLQIENIVEDGTKKMVNIQHKFCVTEKADGERKLLYISSNNKLYFINTNLDVQYSGIKIADGYQNTLFDGEHILYDKHNKYINMYALFDIYFYRGKDCRYNPFIENISIEKAQKYDIDDDSDSDNETNIDDNETAHGDRISPKYTRYSILKSVFNVDGKNDIVKLFKWDTKNNSLKVKFSVKDFKDGNYKVEGRTIFDACNFILQKWKNGSFPYNIDGLIFTSSYLGVGMEKVTEKYAKNRKYTWNHSFKWKPSEFNTIDFLIETEKASFKKERIGSKRIGNDYKQYKTLLLKVGYSDFDRIKFMNPQQNILDMTYNKNKSKHNKGQSYSADYFYPTVPYDIDAHKCQMILKQDTSGKMKMFTEENEIIEDNMIVEFRYDKNEEDKLMRWKPLRVRYDKTEQYIREKSNFGNDYKVANSNWKSIHQPITEEMLSDEGKLDELRKQYLAYDDGKYYNRDKTKSFTKSLRSFHNHGVKKRLYELVVGGRENVSLLDLAVGKAGDLSKWDSTNIKYVFGIDKSEDNIHNAGDGACARYIQKYRPKSNYPIAMFVKGDSTKLLEDGEFAYDEKTKQIYNSLIGRGKKTPKLGKFLHQYYGIFSNKFDIASIQFALHYMFESVETLHKFLRNVSKHVKKGGHFFGTCFDGKRIYEFMKNEEIGYMEQRDIVVNEKKIWHVQRKYSESEEYRNDESCVGMKIGVFQESINREFDEYLVNFEYLTQLLSDYGFQPVSKIIDDKDIQNHLPGIGNFEELYRKPYNNFDMSEEEKMISFMNNYFVYEKVNDMSDLAINQIYDHYTGLKNSDSEMTNDIGIAEKIGVKIELH
jgi:hypothetical protein